MKMTTAVIGAAACLAATTLAAPQAGATVRGNLDIAAPSSLSNYTIGCHYEVRVKVDDATTPVRLVEGAAGSDYRSTVATAIPAADTAILVWTPTQPGRRTLMAVQPTRGRTAYSRPITVSVSNGIVAFGLCFSF